MGHLDYGINFLLYEFPVSAQDSADVGHHIQFEAALLDQPFRFEELGSCCVSTMWEPYCATRGDGCSRQKLRASLVIVRHDADTSDVVRDCKLNTGF